MFWRFGGYASISTLDTILDKPDVTLEELLDEADLIQELKQHNTKLIEYLRDENVLKRLLEYVVAPSADDDRRQHDDGRDDDRAARDAAEREGRMNDEERDKVEKARLKYSYIATEVLSSETWSILEALMENRQNLREFWDFLRRPLPLDNTIAGYFTKINETLLDKKTEEMLDFFKSLDNIVPTMLQHVDCPVIMDLLLKIISLEKAEGGAGIVDWLQSQSLIPSLLSYLSEDHPPATQTSAGDFLKAIITISANASQNEQSCIGPNEMTRQLVSEPCIRSLVAEMLRGGNPLTVGVGIIIEVIRKNNSDYDPDVGAGADSAPTTSDPIYLGTLLRLFATHVPDFMQLILSPKHRISTENGTKVVEREPLKSTFGANIEPLGFDRFKTCELMAELLHCSNMGLLNERGSEAYVKERDRERDRLKAERAAARAEHGSSEQGYSQDGSGFNQGHPQGAMITRSPSEARRLEVANGGDDDGFEDVSASGILSEDAKEDFEDFSAFRHRAPEDSTDPVHFQGKPRLDLGDEFVDEPLLSPRDDGRPPNGADENGDYSEKRAILRSGPLSPRSLEFTEKIGGLEIDHDTVMTSAPPSAADNDNGHPRLEQPSDASSHSSSMRENHHAPPLPHRLEPHETGTSPEMADVPFSPHADDKPAPLFARRTEQPPQNVDLAVGSRESKAAANNNSNDTIDTTHGEEGDSVRSMLLSGNEQEFEPHAETDIDGRPVVGDFLKMMFVEHRVVPTILDFFFRFPWNNFLHNVVYDVVQQVFNGPMDRGYNRSLAIDLFETGRITEHIVEGQRRSDEAQQKNRMRLGYMGHLTLVAEEVVKFSERNPTHMLPQSVLDKVMHKQWIDYVEHTLSETRERDNAILGGVRPDMSVGPRQAVINAVNAAQGYANGGSSALANAGLNGGGAQGLDSIDLANNAGASTGAFGLSGGSLLSGFGSSSDEEDEEMDEGEEHEGAARGGSDQLSTYISTSLLALDNFSSITNAGTTSSALNPSTSPLGPPPPPPPLKIPPSRARRQLAARLALQKQKQAQELAALAEADGGAESATSGAIGDLTHPIDRDLDDATGATTATLLYDEPSEDTSATAATGIGLSAAAPNERSGAQDRSTSISGLFAPGEDDSSASSEEEASSSCSDTSSGEAEGSDDREPDHAASTSALQTDGPAADVHCAPLPDVEQSAYDVGARGHRHHHRRHHHRRRRRPSTTEAATREALDDDDDDDDDEDDEDDDPGVEKITIAHIPVSSEADPAAEPNDGGGGGAGGGEAKPAPQLLVDDDDDDDEEDDGVVEIRRPKRGDLLSASAPSSVTTATAALGEGLGHGN